MSFRSGTGRVVTVSPERYFLSLLLCSNNNSLNTAQQMLAERESEEEIAAYATLSMVHGWNIRQEVLVLFLSLFSLSYISQTVDGAQVLMWIPPKVSEE
jgi:hypothetical protein